MGWKNKDKELQNDHAPLHREYFLSLSLSLKHIPSSNLKNKTNQQTKQALSHNALCQTPGRKQDNQTQTPLQFSLTVVLSSVLCFYVCHQTPWLLTDSSVTSQLRSYMIPTAPWASQHSHGLIIGAPQTGLSALSSSDFSHFHPGALCSSFPLLLTPLVPLHGSTQHPYSAECQSPISSLDFSSFLQFHTSESLQNTWTRYVTAI